MINFHSYSIICLANDLFIVKELKMRRSLVKLSGLVKSVTKMVTGFLKKQQNLPYLLYTIKTLLVKYENIGLYLYFYNHNNSHFTALKETVLTGLVFQFPLQNHENLNLYNAGTFVARVSKVLNLPKSG